jgi:hypothetical protein
VLVLNQFPFFFVWFHLYLKKVELPIELETNFMFSSQILIDSEFVRMTICNHVRIMTCYRDYDKNYTI